MSDYSSTHVAKLYDKTTETIGQWAKEFASYLSPTANPPSGQARRFTEEDLSIFDLVAEMRSKRTPAEDIHAALAAGQRGSVPLVSPDDLQMVVKGEQEIVLQREVQMLRERLAEAQAEIQKLEGLKQHEQLELRKQLDEAIAEKSKMQGQLEQMEKRIAEAEERGKLQGELEYLRRQLTGKSDD